MASQERAGARLVDASTERVEVRIAHDRGAHPGRLGADGWEVPLTSADSGRCHVAGVRYRGLRPAPRSPPRPPGPGPAGPHLGAGRHARVGIELHGWIPGGGTYPDLPDDAAEARRRCRERVRVGEPGPLALRRPLAGGGVTLDLRRLTALHGLDGRSTRGGAT